MPILGDRLRVLRSKNSRLFFSGQFISVTGTWMQSVAQSWLVYRMTGSAWWLGAIHFASQFPVMLLAPAGGLVADRYSRHRIVITTQALLMVQAAVLAGLTLTGKIQVWQVAVLAVIMGAINAFDIPARQSMVADIPDDPADRPSIIAMNASVFNSARVLGPALAGMIVAASSEGFCFLFNAISFLAVLVSLFAMKLKSDHSTPHPSFGWPAIKEGWLYARQTSAIRTPLIFLGFCSFAGMSYAILLPVFAKEILSGGPELFGVLTGTVGAGAVTGTLTLFWLELPSNALKKLLAIANLIFGLSLVVLSQSTRVEISLPTAFLLGMSQVMLLVGTNTWLQVAVPDTFRGRVISLYSMMVIGMTALGSLAVGHFAHSIGPVWTLTAGGCLTAFAAIMYGVSFGWGGGTATSPTPDPSA